MRAMHSLMRFGAKSLIVPAVLSIVLFSDRPCRAQALEDDPPVAASDNTEASQSRGSDIPAAPAAKAIGRWNVLLYHALMTDNTFWQVIRGDMQLRYGFIDTVDVSYEVARENVFQIERLGRESSPGKKSTIGTIATPFAGSLFLGAAFTRRADPTGPIIEVAPNVMWRTRRIPLVGPFRGRLGIGDGVSYVDHLPAKEDGQQWMNFLAVETGLGLSQHGGVELVARVHHRCKAWGLFGDGRSSNAIGVGLRASF